MENTVFLESHSTIEDYHKSNRLKLPLQSFITLSIYKCCAPDNVSLKFVHLSETTEDSLFLDLNNDSIFFVDTENAPFLVSSCLYPVVMYEDTLITGMCAVARHICKFRSLSRCLQEHEEGLLGFRSSCLQAPNEVSIWTKFCEIDIVKTVKEMLHTEKIQIMPMHLIRFESHLKKPVRVHNVYKIARELKKVNLQSNHNAEPSKQNNENTKMRVAKIRKWKSNTRKELEIDCTMKMEELEICHQFAEGPFLTLADLILLPSYHIIINCFGEKTFEPLLPLTYKWYINVSSIPELQTLVDLIQNLKTKALLVDNVITPVTVNTHSLYKCDPKRHNPKKRLFTKEEEIEKALNTLIDGIEFHVVINDFENKINWDDIPHGANPFAGHLPDDRKTRKSQQLENLTLAVLSIAKEGDVIVDFCSGSGHLGILVAYLLPKCTIILLENKEQSLLRARERVHNMGLKNIYFFQCNLDFYVGKFDIGIALHACGVASDLVLDKCLKVNAKFVLCPCCYGSLHSTDRLIYPRSSKFKIVPIDQYLCISHAADQTHEDHPMSARGARCMAIIDSDRASLAEEFGYKVTLSRLKPLSCTPKNNLLIGIPV